MYKSQAFWNVLVLLKYTTVTAMRCDNLIPGMALCKQNLPTCALAVTFEILSLRSCALCETMVPLSERVWKIVFQNTSQ
jgi:hypothetical protein